MKRSRVSEDVVVFFCVASAFGISGGALGGESGRLRKGRIAPKRIAASELFVRLARTVQDCCVLRLVTNVSQQRVILYVRVAEKPPSMLCRSIRRADALSPRMAYPCATLYMASASLTPRSLIFRSVSFRSLRPCLAITTQGVAESFPDLGVKAKGIARKRDRSPRQRFCRSREIEIREATDKSR